MIPIYKPYIEKYTNSAIEAIQDGWISNHGKYVEKSVELLKSIMNVPYCILMANGTCASHCLFIALKHKYPNVKTIYVPNNVYVAAWNAVLMEYDFSSIKVLAIDENTWNVKLSDKDIMNLDQDSAVLIVHNIGNIYNTKRLSELRPDIVIIEDNCEGLFGKYNNVYSGSSSKTLCSAISFYGNKTITSGEGGAFVTHDKEVFEYIKKVYSQGMSDKYYIHEVLAYNYRMTNVQAAFLYDQLVDHKHIVEMKKRVFDIYNELFDCLIKTNKVSIQKEEENTERSYWMYAIRIYNLKETFEDFRKKCNEKGFDIRPFFYPINYHTHLKSIIFNDEISKKLSEEIIMIPSYPTITYEEQKYIVENLNNLIENSI